MYTSLSCNWVFLFLFYYYCSFSSVPTLLVHPRPLCTINTFVHLTGTLTSGRCGRHRGLSGLSFRVPFRLRVLSRWTLSRRRRCHLTRILFHRIIRTSTDGTPERLYDGGPCWRENDMLITSTLRHPLCPPIHTYPVPVDSAE